MTKTNQPGLSKLFFKMAGNAASVVIDVGLSGFSAALVPQIPSPVWQGVAVAFSVASAGCAYDSFKALKKNYRTYDNLVCQKIDSLFADDLPLRSSLSVD